MERIVAKAIGKFIDTLIRIADKFHFDRDELFLRVTHMMIMTSETYTFKDYEVDGEE